MTVEEELFGKRKGTRKRRETRKGKGGGSEYGQRMLYSCMKMSQ
jgi:hypothetical protein